MFTKKSVRLPSHCYAHGEGFSACLQTCDSLDEAFETHAFIMSEAVTQLRRFSEAVLDHDLAIVADADTIQISGDSEVIESLIHDGILVETSSEETAECRCAPK